MAMPQITLGRLVAKLVDAWPLIVTVAGATWVLSAQVSNFQARIDKISADQAAFVESFQVKLKDLRDSQYTLSQACEQAFRFCMDNPGVVVRDPRDLNKVISMQNRTMPTVGGGE